MKKELCDRNTHVGYHMSADLYYHIVNIIHEESKQYEYKPNVEQNIAVIDEDGVVYTRISLSRYMNVSRSLLDNMKLGTGRTFPIPQTEIFMSKTGFAKLKSSSLDKADIHIIFHNLRTNMKLLLGFNINSFLGSNTILFNAGAGTNFIYEVVLPKGVLLDCDEFNRNTYPKTGRIGVRLKTLRDDYGANIVFKKVQSNCFYQNLLAIDGHMPLLLAELLLIKSEHGYNDIRRCTEELTRRNPLGIDTATHGNIYEYKIKRFLQDCAQGMTPEKPWLGIYDATGGQIIVKEDGDIVCYHIYELNRFREFLFNSTKFEGASTSEDSENPGHPRPNASKTYYYGWVYEENEKYYIKINLQVRSK